MARVIKGIMIIQYLGVQTIHNSHKMCNRFMIQTRFITDIGVSIFRVNFRVIRVIRFIRVVRVLQHSHTTVVAVVAVIVGVVVLIVVVVALVVVVWQCIITFKSDTEIAPTNSRSSSS